MVDFSNTGLLYLIIYIFFNIWIFTKYQSKLLKFYSVMLQFAIITDIIINYTLYVPITSSIITDLILLCTLFMICANEIYTSKGDY